MYLLCKKGTIKIGNDLIPVMNAKTASGDWRPLELQNPDSELYQLYKNAKLVLDPKDPRYSYQPSHWETADGRKIAPWGDPRRQLWAQGSYRLFQSMRAIRLHKALCFGPRNKDELFAVEVTVHFDRMELVLPSPRSR